MEEQQVNPKYIAIIKIKEKLGSMKKIRDATEALFGYDPIPNKFQWKKGSIDTDSYLGELMKKLTVHQLDILASPEKGKRVAKIARQRQATLPVSVYDVQNAVTSYLKNHPISQLTARGIMTPRWIGKGRYEYQQPTGMSQYQLAGFNNALRMHTWASEIQELDKQLSAAEQNVQQLINGMYQCIDENVISNQGKVAIINCLNGLLQVSENRDRIGAQIMESVAKLKSAQQDYVRESGLTDAYASF